MTDKDNQKQCVDHSERLSWSEENRPAKSLKPYEHNPRKISESQYNKLKQSVEKFGYASRILITPSGLIVGGHQRLRVLKDLGVKDVPVLVSNRELSDREYQELMLRDNVSNGEWDDDILANVFDVDMIMEAGTKEHKDLMFGMEAAENPRDGKSYVRCPNCAEEFPAKGNKVQR